MNHIETITASGFELYRQLKAQGYRAESLQALHIAQEIHEVKKGFTTNICRHFKDCW
ncbi:hypothetical protein OL548_05340 [Lysinibacillus sp. MHQ-1]|nr:hypothetical protein OL548_05340 [Lysinibacillus sp. MHQ-1]